MGSLDCFVKKNPVTSTATRLIVPSAGMLAIDDAKQDFREARKLGDLPNKLAKLIADIWHNYAATK